jgi:hypothetical protein
VLKKQFEAESATIVARRNSLQQEQNLLGFTVERQNEIYQLNTDLIDVAERLKGVESEQLSNKNALLREQIDLQNTVFENENSRQLAQLDFEASIAKTEEDKLAKQRERLELENKLIEEDLETKRGLYALGTQARVDAEQEFLNKKQEIDNNLTKLNIESEELRAEKQRELESQELAARQAFEASKFQIVDQTLSLIAGLAGKSKAVATALLLVEKGLAISQVVTSASRSIAQATANLAAVPAFIGVVPNPAYIGQAVATAKGIAATKLSAGLSIANILAQGIGKLSGGGNLGGGGGDSGGGGGGGAPSAPSFNLVAGTGTNQIAQSLAGQNQPLQAFVVGSAVTSQQELDRNQIDTASL